MDLHSFKNTIYRFRAKVSNKLIPRLARRFKLRRSFNNGFTYLSYPPEYLQIDITGFCNLTCIMCPQGIEDGVPEKGHMDFSLYQKVVDSGVEAGIFTVLLVLTGEPLLHKNIIKMIRYAKDKHCKVTISTNCTLLTPAMSEELIKSGLDEIILSIDTVKKELYENYRRGAKFEEVMSNILTFLEIRKKLKSATPFPVMQNLQKFNPDKHTPEIEEDFKEVFGKYDIWIQPKYFSNWSGAMKEKELYREAGINSNSEYQLCPTVYQRIVVSWDGKVVSCCNDFKREQIMGDVNLTSIAEIWNGLAFVNLREKLRDKKYEEMPLCKSCGTLWK